MMKNTENYSSGIRIEAFIDGYLKGKSRKDIVKDFVKILEQEKF